jgi:hypothetical protein
MRRRLVLGGALLALAACHRQPSFDERYASAQQALGSEAAALDSDLATREADAAAAGATDEPVTTAE